MTLARIVRPQGRRGEVLADLFTDFPDLFTTAADLRLQSASGAHTPLQVEGVWMPTGRNAGRIVLKLRGTDSISDAEKLAGAAVEMPLAQRLALDDQTYYVSDLVGCILHNGEQPLGKVADVHFPVDAEGRRLQEAAPLFAVLRSDGSEILVPFANAFVRVIDLSKKKIVMDLPEGLAELNG